MAARPARKRGLGPPPPPPPPICKHNARAWVCKSFICFDACLHGLKKAESTLGLWVFSPLGLWAFSLVSTPAVPSPLASPLQGLSRPCCKVSVPSVVVPFPPTRGSFFPLLWLSPSWTVGLSLVSAPWPQFRPPNKAPQGLSHPCCRVSVPSVVVPFPTHGSFLPPLLDCGPFHSLAPPSSIPSSPLE